MGSHAEALHEEEELKVVTVPHSKIAKDSDGGSSNFGTYLIVNEGEENRFSPDFPTFRIQLFIFCLPLQRGWPEVMRKATLPKVERVNRLEGQLKGGFLDVMMGEVFSPQHFYIQVSQTKKICESVHHMNVLQLKDPGSEKPGYELDDLVDEMEDTYCKLSNLDHYIPFDELTVRPLSY